MRYGIPRTHWLITMPRIQISNFNDAVAGLSDIKREERKKEPVNGSSENNQDNEVKTQPVNRQAYAKAWIVVVAAVVVIYTFYLLFNLYRTAVTDYDKYARAAADEQWTLVTYSASRGLIYDANMVPLASNTYDYTLICSPKMVTSTLMTREQIMDGVVNILGVSYEKLDKMIPVDPTDKTDKRNDVAGCDVIKNISVEKKDEFAKWAKDNKVKGFAFVAVPQRYYNYGSLASQVIGYAKNDGVSLNGLYGLEAYYNTVLSGDDGYRYSETDEITGGILMLLR